MMPKKAMLILAAVLLTVPAAAFIASSAQLQQQRHVSALLWSLSASKSKMSNDDDDCEKKIAFVRHGCTYMNEFLGRSLRFGAPHFSDVFDEKERDAFYQDSPLSPRGIRQAQSLLAQQKPAFVHNCELVVTSPLTRALQTLEIGLQHHFCESVPVVALPQAAERLYLISDVGKKRSLLEENYPNVDFTTGFDGHDEDKWWYQPTDSDGYVEWRPTGKGQRYACPGESQEDFDTRMQSLVSWLDDRPEQNIAVVCHHGVIDWLLDMDFDNCQWRQVPFSSLRERASSMLPRNIPNE